MAATIMTWFSRGIPFGIGQSRSKWNILNTSIKTWMANLSIGDEDNCCQCSSFDHSVSIEPGSLLCSPPRDFKQYWIWPSLRSERKSSKRVRFESDYLGASSYQCHIHIAVRCTMCLDWAPGATRLQHPLHLPISDVPGPLRAIGTTTWATSRSIHFQTCNVPNEPWKPLHINVIYI